MIGFFLSSALCALGRPPARSGFQPPFWSRALVERAAPRRLERDHEFTRQPYGVDMMNFCATHTASSHLLLSTDTTHGTSPQRLLSAVCTGGTRRVTAVIH